MNNKISEIYGFFDILKVPQWIGSLNSDVQQLVWFIMLNATFNNISVISWLSVLLVEEPGENHQPVASHWKTLLHNVVSGTPHHEQGSNLQL